MDENQNQYKNFKEGIKTDIKETGASLFLVGGLILFAGILFALLSVAIKDKTMSDTTRIITIGGVLGIAGLLIFNKKIRMWILGGWLILLILIPVSFIVFLVGYMFYSYFTQPL